MRKEDAAASPWDGLGSRAAGASAGAENHHAAAGAAVDVENPAVDAEDSQKERKERKDRKDRKDQKDQKEASSLRTMLQRGARFGGHLNPNISATHAVLFLRVAALLPMPSFILWLLFVRPATRTSAAVDTIKIPVQVSACFTLYCSRFVYYISKRQKPAPLPNKWEAAETLVVVLGSCAATALIHATSADGSSIDWGSTLRDMVVVILYQGLIILPLHLFIKQVMNAQKQAITGYAFSLFAKGALALFINITMSMYVAGAMVPGWQSSSDPLSNEMGAFQPAVLSTGYTCASESAFLNYTRRFPAVFEEIGTGDGACTVGSGGLGDGQWCGFPTWEEACWRLGTVPALVAIKLDTANICIFVWLSVLLDAVFVGRGIIKRNRRGALDASSVRFLSRPRVIF
jgi:hypothetical protein